MHHLIPVLYADRVDVVNMPGPSRLHGRDELAHTAQRSVIMSGVSLPELSISFKMSQLNSQNSRLDSVHPAIPPNHAVIIFADLAVIPKDPNLLLQLGIASHNRAGFAEGAKILPRVEAETSCVGKGADLSTLILSSVRLAGILDDEQTVLPRNFHNWIHVRRLAK